MVTAIYHTFLKGNSKERYLFAGSKTLAAFESRSYYVRTASMRTNVEMRRTPRGSIDSILHLRLKECRTGSINNLLFSDFSGEDYSAVSANVVAAKEDFQIVNAARQIVVLLDGEKMITRQRLSELQSAIHILKTFLDGDIIRRDARVIIAISKYDLVSSRDDRRLDKFINSIITRVEELIDVLDPYDDDLLQVAPTVWEQLYQKFCGISAAYSVRIKYAQFVLPIILRSDNCFADELVRFAFTTVHKILANDNMDYCRWEKLSELLPDVVWYNSWDKCKRLRKAARRKQYDVDFYA